MYLMISWFFLLPSPPKHSSLPDYRFASPKKKNFHQAPCFIPRLLTHQQPPFKVYTFQNSEPNQANQKESNNRSTEVQVKTGINSYYLFLSPLKIIKKKASFI